MKYVWALIVIERSKRGEERHLQGVYRTANAAKMHCAAVNAAVNDAPEWSSEGNHTWFKSTTLGAGENTWSYIIRREYVRP